jgi:hypothetical protein
VHLRQLIARIESIGPNLRWSPVPAREIDEFERRHALRLPDEYRLFIREVGIGPGLMPLGAYEDDGILATVVGDPARPFPHDDAWQLLGSYLRVADLDGVEDASEEMDAIYDEAEERMQDAILDDPSILRTDGFIPVADLGCREWAALITGVPAPDGKGEAPLRFRSGAP